MSTPSPRFLLDENVRVELARFLKAKRLDVRAARKSSQDPSLASLSKKEKRILVTNDEDFIEYTREEIFAVVWLRLAQNDPEGLVSSFKKLLAEVRIFEERLIILRRGEWDNFALSRSFKFGKIWDFKS